MRNGDHVKWRALSGAKRWGVITSLANSYSVEVARYTNFLRPQLYSDLVEKYQLTKFTDAQLSKLNEDSKLITIGRLIYNQHFFRSPKYKKPEWRLGFKRYQKLCKEYGIPLNPKRPVSRMSGQW